jgi:hypothetical protein
MTVAWLVRDLVGEAVQSWRSSHKENAMARYARFFGVALAVITTLGMVSSRGPAQSKRPQVTGDWVGTWGISAPPKAGEAPAPSRHSGPELRLDCKVEEPRNGTWQATFEGECGRPYKYTVKMQGRQAGDVVLFHGSADLGEKDGGVYDWIGRATEDEFVGFYTSQKYTGHFRLARSQSAASSKQ